MTFNKTYIKDHSHVLQSGMWMKILPNEVLATYNAQQHSTGHPYKLITFLSDPNEKVLLYPDPLRYNHLEIVCADLISEAEAEAVYQNNLALKNGRPRPRLFSYSDCAEIFSFLEERRIIQYANRSYNYKTGTFNNTPEIIAWRDVVISCNAGMSRSAGCGLALKELQGQSKKAAPLYVKYAPNSRIYWMMINFWNHKQMKKLDDLLGP